MHRIITLLELRLQADLQILEDFFCDLKFHHLLLFSKNHQT